jgi:sporulation protein YlmC with PRC-barrel domain
MEKITSYISKKVISLDDGNMAGYVLNVFFDENIKTFAGLIIVDEESENSFVLPRSEIVSVGEDCVMIENALKLKYNISSSNSPIGKLVYDIHGNMLGRVTDIEVAGKWVKKVITDKCEFPQRYIRTAGEKYIIYGNPKKKEKEVTFPQLKEISSANGLINENVHIQNNQKQDSPTILLANPNVLVGKIVTNDILGFNNEVIARKFDIIDKNIINKAKLHNKINLLSFYSK